MREETIIKKRIVAYKQHYKNYEITLEQFLNGVRKKKYKIKKGPENFKKETYCFDKNSGKLSYVFNSVVETSKYFGVRVKYVSRIINKTNKTCKGFIIMSSNYCKENNIEEVKITYKSKEKDYYLNRYRQKYKTKETRKNKLLVTNKETGERITYNSVKYFSKISNLKEKYIRKVLSGEKKSYKGFLFKLLKEK